MELPEWGKNCEKSGCNDLDFLPIKCNLCRKTYCKIHYSYDQHSCEKWGKLSDQEKLEAKKDLKVLKFRCKFEGCDTKEISEIQCPKCQLNFCLDHRLEKDHLCSFKKEAHMPKTTELVNQITSKSRDQPPLKTIKNQKTAAKVNLMKLKMNSSGKNGIPTQDRVYFKVCLPLIKKERTKNVFVSKTWSLGRTLDVIADHCSVTNRNNTSDEKQLKLFKHVDGFLVNNTLDETVEELLRKEVIFNGDCLILEYVLSEENSIVTPNYNN